MEKDVLLNSEKTEQNRFMKALFKISIILLALLPELGWGQNAKYLVLFKDKTGTPFTIDQPQQFLSPRSISRRAKQKIAITSRDLPVNPSYLAQIRQTGAKVWYSSRWLNAALVEANTSQLAAIQQFSFYKGIEFGKILANARVAGQQDLKKKFGTESLDYGMSAAQIKMLGVDVMHDKGYHGEGMLIGIFDAGFLNSNNNSAMAPIYAENRVIKTFDFVKKETTVYEDDSHGNNVFSIMSSYLPASLIGPAYKASYVLLRTEDTATETRLEEANWLFGAEYADSLGVDVINTSLGYTEFDNPLDNYTYTQMDGKTTLITRAADWAAAAGIVVVASAGNEGAAAWKYIGAPADADSILAVGAVNSVQAIAGFSSYGPSADGRVKPDVSAMGSGTILSSPANSIVAGSGTSYSSPLIAAFAAGFWQAYPYLNAMQVIDCIRKAGSIYKTPNNRLGYGIPTFERAAAIADKEYPPLSCCPPLQLTKLKLYPNPVIDQLTLQFSSVQIGQTVSAQILNSNGQMLWQGDIMASQHDQNWALPVSLSAGSYILMIQGKLLNQSLKFIKQ